MPWYCRSVLHNISEIWQFLSNPTAKIFIEALIICCSVTLASFPLAFTSAVVLHRYRNAAAKTILLVCFFDHVTLFFDHKKYRPLPFIFKSLQISHYPRYRLPIWQLLLQSLYKFRLRIFSLFKETFLCALCSSLSAAELSPFSFFIIILCYEKPWGCQALGIPDYLSSWLRKSLLLTPACPTSRNSWLFFSNGML